MVPLPNALRVDEARLTQDDSSQLEPRLLPVVPWRSRRTRLWMSAVDAGRDQTFDGRRGRPVNLFRLDARQEVERVLERFQGTRVALLKRNGSGRVG